MTSTVDAPPEKCFWIHNGPIIKNLKELLAALKKMKKDTFRHHVNKDKNDFSKWVNDVLGNKGLAEDIKKTRSKKTLMEKIEKEIKKIEKAVRV